MAEYEMTEKTSTTEAEHRKELAKLMQEFENTENTPENRISTMRNILLVKYAASNNKGRSK